MRQRWCVSPEVETVAGAVLLGLPALGFAAGRWPVPSRSSVVVLEFCPVGLVRGGGFRAVRRGAGPAAVLEPGPQDGVSRASHCGRVERGRGHFVGDGVAPAALGLHRGGGSLGAARRAGSGGGVSVGHGGRMSCVAACAVKRTPRAMWGSQPGRSMLKACSLPRRVMKRRNRPFGSDQAVTCSHRSGSTTSMRRGVLGAGTIWPVAFVQLGRRAVTTRIVMVVAARMSSRFLISGFMVRDSSAVGADR